MKSDVGLKRKDSNIQTTKRGIQQQTDIDDIDR